MRSRPLALLLVLGLAGLAPAAGAKVYLSRAEALQLAFPEADRVESRTLILEEGQVRRIESLARSPVESRLVTFHTGVKEGEVVGYAFIDVHTVRTLPEAFLIVMSPEGRIRSLRVLAFYEPEEYRPGDRWLAQFDRRSLDPDLRLGGEIHGIAGATLSARAVTGSVRRSLAIFEVLVRPEQNPLSSGRSPVELDAGEPGRSPSAGLAQGER